VAFTIAVIALSAKMAKADGVVSPLEHDAFAEVFHFARSRPPTSSAVFDLAKQDVAGYEVYAGQIAALLKDDASSCSTCWRA